MRTRTTLTTLVLALALVSSACGDDSNGDSEQSGATETTVATESADGGVLDSCTIVDPSVVDGALGVTGATGTLGAGGDCLWEADTGRSVLNTRIDPPAEGINLSGLLDDTNITVPLGDQAYYGTESQCLEGVQSDQRIRVCVFADVPDPEAAAQTVFAAAVANV